MLIRTFIFDFKSKIEVLALGQEPLFLYHKKPYVDDAVLAGSEAAAENAVYADYFGDCLGLFRGLAASLNGSASPPAVAI